MVSRQARCFASVIVALVLWTALPAAAAHPVYRASPDGPAIDGYDVVAYFTVGRPVKGSPLFRHFWQDTEWHFSSEAHRDLFVADPERYAPQFGGYCAYALSRSRLYEGNPEVFAIEDGKLYFNNNSAVMERWRSAPDPFIDAARNAYPRVIQTEESRPNSEHAPASASD